MSRYTPHDKTRLAELIGGRGHIDLGGNLGHEKRASWARAVAASLCARCATDSMVRGRRTGRTCRGVVP